MLPSGAAAGSAGDVTGMGKLDGHGGTMSPLPTLARFHLPDGLRVQNAWRSNLIYLRDGQAVDLASDVDEACRLGNANRHARSQ